MDDTGSPLLSLKDVQLTYKIEGRTLSVLKKVSLNVFPGEMVAILGPSGSGKSTLLYILGCLLKPTGGSYLLSGREVTRLGENELATYRSEQIGFVFQQFHLLPRADVLENILLPSQYRHGETALNKTEAEEKAKLLLEDVGLTGHLHHRPNQLSGGQQQRVAIARALMNNPMLILADEPTGNLDSNSAGQVLELLGDLHKRGRTILIITHDLEVAKRCERIVTIRDGLLEDLQGPILRRAGAAIEPTRVPREAIGATVKPLRALGSEHWLRYAETAWRNLSRNKGRSLLTMLGVTIGIAAVLATITLGSYTRKTILKTYESLGVNKVVVRAYPRWNLQAKDLKGTQFDGISRKNDILPMRRLFPSIRLVSPVVQDWSQSVEFGGHHYDEAKILGVNPEYFLITNRRLISGHAFTSYHNENHSRVCLIGFEVAKRLFTDTSPLRKIIQINGNNNQQYSCLVLGVMAQQSSNNEWFKPDQQILLPDEFLSAIANKWNAKPYELDVQLMPETPIESTGEQIKKYFHQKYGRSAEVRVDSDQILIAQMRRFLDLFAILLSAVAFISLAVGGIGIANMMLVSVAERFKEIGLRKALGAQNHEIRMQFLVESTILCFFAGLMGVVIGVAAYESVLLLASELSAKVRFVWIFNPFAILVSVVCIFAVGVASGIVPAIRAQRLEVVEALRSE